MKTLIFAAFCFCAFSISALAQNTETFDIATFQPPKGWERKAGPDGVQFSTEDKSTGAFCLITLFRSVPALGNSKENFSAAWQTVVKEAVNVKAAPQMQPSNNPEDWKVEMGAAPFEQDGLKGVVVLVTASGYGKMINAMILTNTQTYEPQIAAFLESFSFKKPEAGKQVNANSERRQPADNQTGSQPSITQHFWKQTQNRRDVGGYAGYSSNTYQFFSNNTYKFSQVTFQNYAPKYYVEDEEGTYKVSGNTITLVPKKAGYRTHRSTREDPVLKSGNLPLTTLEYSFEFMDLNNNWALLLSPLNGMETKRDGHFTFWLEGQKQKTYTYSAVNAAGEIVR